MTDPAPRIAGRRLHPDPLFEPSSLRLPNPQVVDLFRSAWENSTRVRGAFGWFNAGWVSAFAHGIAAFLEEDDAHVDLTIAPVLFAAEHDRLSDVLRGNDVTSEDAVAHVVAVLDEGTASRSAVTRYAVDALAWMIVNGRLTLRVAVPVQDSNYHPKVWLFEDGYDIVAVRGSANATGRALTSAIEHLDVDPSWRDRYRVQAYADMVSAWAAGNDDKLERTYVLDADVLAQKVSRMAPDTPPTQTEYKDAVHDDNEGDTIDAPTAPADASLRIPTWLNWETGKYAHQAKAVAAWEDPATRESHLTGHGTARDGILSVVTGGGKTKTALICATRLHHELDAPLLIVIVVPGPDLADQWRIDLEDFLSDNGRVGMPTRPSHRPQTSHLLHEHAFVVGRHLTILLCTPNKLTDPSFQSDLKHAMSLSAPPDTPDGHALLIADEAHKLGAVGFMSNAPTMFSYHLGLTATLERYDDDETAALEDYLGGSVYEFDLQRAQAAGALVQYDYIPLGVAELNDDEVADYREITAKVGKAMGDDDALSMVLAQRRAILECAEAKYAIFERFVDDMVAQGDLRDTIIYCSAKDRTQMERVTAILNDRPTVRYAVIVSETSSPDRNLAIKDFAEGRIDVLVAKKILDEGIDLPSVRKALLLASSTTEREWVQRRGRVLRTDPSDPDKHAIVYDIPALTTAAGLTDAAHATIVTTECARMSTFNNDAANSMANNDFITSTRDKYLGIE